MHALPRCLLRSVLKGVTECTRCSTSSLAAGHSSIGPSFNVPRQTLLASFYGRIVETGRGRLLLSIPSLRSWTSKRLFNTFGSSRRRRLIPEIPEEIALYGLIGANVAVFLAWRGDAQFMLRHFTTSWDAVREGRVHTLVLSAFSQRNSWHLISNMIGLYFFGRNVAWLLGGRGLILLYLAGGTFGSLVYVTGQAVQSSKTEYRTSWSSGQSYRTPHIPSLGSSGAVNSIVMFEILMVPTATVLLYGILPVPAWILGGLFLFMDIIGALGHGSANIGYTAHLGGAAVGALTCLGVKRGRVPSRWRRW